ncbi:zinc finger BED domain-containing protein 5-like [Tubulanus polymorphus]|uniref:zinc finger BED domain-containing protein 5-like n=1 Tax=Tubulanus polymorphus TaxID=672921 RepID=UPI003DA1D207
MKKSAIAVQQSIIRRLRTQPFTHSTDGSNDDNHGKQYPIVVRLFNGITKNVDSELLSVPTIDGRSTGENIFKLLDSELRRNNIKWENCLALGLDNTNVNVGDKNGVIAFAKKKNPDIYLSGCVLHLVHIVARKAASAHLPGIDDILVDVFNYLKKSDKRQLELASLTTECGLAPKPVLEHGQTRWLSIGRCIERLIYNWEPLKKFFNKEKAPKAADNRPNQAYAKAKSQSLCEFFRSPTYKLYCLFLNYAVHVFDDILLNLQSQFTFDKVQYKLNYNRKPNHLIMIGDEAQSFIKDKDKNYLKDTSITEFYANIVKYYTSLLDYMLDKLPVSDKLLHCCEVADISLKESVPQSHLKFFFR